MPRKTKTKTKTKSTATPPPDASLLGIPPEMRNAIYRLVADDIHEVNIIGRKLDRSKATSSDHAWLWNAMAKHPLSQTCRQLRQEFDPIHEHCALTKGVARYRLELENFDVERINTFAEVIPNMPKGIQGQLKKAVDRDGSIIRFNLTDRIIPSIDKLKRGWRDLGSIFSKLRRALNGEIYSTSRSHEINLNFKHRTMSPALKRIAPVQDLVASAKRALKRICGDVAQAMGRESSSHGRDWPSVYKLRILYEKLDDAHKNHFRPLREAREEKAKKALKQQLEVELRERLRHELKAELRDELKEELRTEVTNEPNAEAEAKLDRQTQEGLESWSTGDVPQS